MRPVARERGHMCPQKEQIRHGEREHMTVQMFKEVEGLLSLNTEIS